MSDSAAPGWYHAQGDPPGTERYWDGLAWTEGPRPVGGSSIGPVDDAPTVDTSAASNFGADAETEIDSPESPGPSNMPVMGSSAGLDSGFPSMDDPPLTGSYGAGQSNIPGSAPAPFGQPPTANSPNYDTPVMGGPGATPNFGGFPGAPSGGYGMGGWTEQSQAPTGLVLSIVGLFCCGLPAIAGIYLGYTEKKGIDDGRRDPSNRGIAIASLAIGAIAVVLWSLFALLLFLPFAFF